MSLRKFIVTAGMLLGVIAGSAQASTLTGTVAYYFTQDNGGGQVYTFANLLTSSGNAVCYYIGTNTSLAGIFKTAQATGKPVTMNCTSNVITQVSN